jgi:hypothetical protein
MSRPDDPYQVPSRAARRDRSVRQLPGRQRQPDLPEVEDGGAARVAWLPLELAAGIDLVALALIALGDGRLPSYVAAAAVHLMAVIVLLTMGADLGRSRRILTASLVFALPLSGVAVAALALGTRRRTVPAAAIPADDVESPTLDAACFQKIAEALSPCEVLSAPGNEERWATLSALTRRGDADAVRLLHWLTTASPDTAVDAALALEEVSMRFDAGLDRCRVELAEDPSAATALDEGTFIASAIESGLVDPVMLEARAAEARRCFALARELEPARAEEVTEAWASMELAAMHPEAALRLVEEALAREADDRGLDTLIELREQARFASHEHLGGGLRAEALGAQQGSSP